MAGAALQGDTYLHAIIDIQGERIAESLQYALLLHHVTSSFARCRYIFVCNTEAHNMGFGHCQVCFTCHRDSGMRGLVCTAVTSLIRAYLCIFMVIVGPCTCNEQHVSLHTCVVTVIVGLCTCNEQHAFLHTCRPRHASHFKPPQLMYVCLDENCESLC